MRKLGVDEWVLRLVQGMYSNTRSRVRVGDAFSDEFEVKLGVHQDLVLSPLLFTVLLETLSQDVRAAVSWEELYTDTQCRQEKDHDLW